MSKVIIVVNAGSSSLKFTLFPAATRPQSSHLICKGEIEGIGHIAHFVAKQLGGKTLIDEPATGVHTPEHALAAVLRWLERQFPEQELVAAGHRVVHGGTRFLRSVQVDGAILAELCALSALAPLHQPQNLAAIDALFKLHPSLPQVACFDTAFHHTMPVVATAFALPRQLTDGGVRRYGFHGLSYDYIASVLPEYLGPTADGRVIVAHLGSGASLCAMRGRKSMATTMGFTPLDGLPMGTRCGSLDPGVVLYLMQEKGLSFAEISDLLYHSSGMLGVSGISDDMRTLLASGDTHAQEAIDLFVYHIGLQIGSLTAALGGVDAIVFTAGIGEHAPEIRSRVLDDAAWLGVTVDETANVGPRLTMPESRVSAWVIPTDEDLVIARQSWDVLHPSVPDEAASG
jgi:acetate kinase